ncbi:hypothetical protein GA0070624_4806 [Micromonospora rhizosphaerae]|uniref:Uncharacterized protein n=1 Tax=Micromonospora rhizosphaerae TaxID=568872 RepID=A0A1C6SWR1_9ACTN|nr:hypothetical protein [Micromonospora rhizosphaerae]SCL33723.1 hypothetical protein GA0070624_4806 [Micromonospora rhizosphaerae]
MRTEPIQIDGLAGPVVVTAPNFRPASITVGDQTATRTRANNYLLPAADGTMKEAKLHGGLFDAYPTIEIAGVKHRTGPAVPALLQILAVLPFVVFIFVLRGGLIGGLIGGIAMGVNLGIARGARSTPAKAGLMICVLAGGAVALLMIAGVLQRALA